MSDPIRQPSLLADIRTIAKRVTALERASTRRFTAQVLPMAPILAPVGTAGFVGATSSSEEHAYRVDGHLTSPFLQYDFTVSDFIGSASSLIEWTINGYLPDDGIGPIEVLYGSQAGGSNQVAGILDLRTVASLPVVMGSYVRFDILVQQTGGTVIAVRLNTPMHLRPA